MTKCEICQRKVETSKEAATPNSGKGALTGEFEHGIMNETQETREAFSSLCRQCQEEIWDTDTLSQPRYPYQN